MSRLKAIPPKPFAPISRPTTSLTENTFVTESRTQAEPRSVHPGVKKLDKKYIDASVTRLSRPSNKFSLNTNKAAQDENQVPWIVEYFREHPDEIDTGTPTEKLAKVDEQLKNYDLELDERQHLLNQRRQLLVFIDGEDSVSAAEAGLQVAVCYTERGRYSSALTRIKRARQPPAGNAPSVRVGAAVGWAETHLKMAEGTTDPEEKARCYDEAAEWLADVDKLPSDGELDARRWLVRARLADAREQTTQTKELWKNAMEKMSYLKGDCPFVAELHEEYARSREAAGDYVMSNRQWEGAAQVWRATAHDDKAQKAMSHYRDGIEEPEDYDTPGSRYVPPLTYRLWVRCVSAHGLPRCDANAPDGFLKVTYGREERETQEVPNDYNPVWNQEFSFEVTEPSGPIKFELMDKDIMRDDLLDTAVLELAEVCSGDVYQETLHLRCGATLKVDICLVGKFDTPWLGAQVVQDCPVPVSTDAATEYSSFPPSHADSVAPSVVSAAAPRPVSPQPRPPVSSSPPAPSYIPPSPVVSSGSPSGLGSGSSNAAVAAPPPAREEPVFVEAEDPSTEQFVPTETESFDEPRGNSLHPFGFTDALGDIAALGEAEADAAMGEEAEGQPVEDYANDQEAGIPDDQAEPQ